MIEDEAPLVVIISCKIREKKYFQYLRVKY